LKEKGKERTPGRARTLGPLRSNTRRAGLKSRLPRVHPATWVLLGTVNLERLRLEDKRCLIRKSQTPPIEPGCNTLLGDFDPTNYPCGETKRGAWSFARAQPQENASPPKFCLPTAAKPTPTQITFGFREHLFQFYQGPIFAI